MAKERFKLVPAVYLILRQGDSVLLSLRQNTGYADGCYGLVAGHLDGGESAIEGMRREAREEIGLDIPYESLALKVTMHRLAPQREVIDLFFVAEEWSGTLTNLEPEKCGALEFFPLDALPENIIPYIREAILAVANGKQFIEHGWEENKMSQVA